MPIKVVPPKPTPFLTYLIRFKVRADETTAIGEGLEKLREVGEAEIEDVKVTKEVL